MNETHHTTEEESAKRDRRYGWLLAVTAFLVVVLLVITTVLEIQVQTRNGRLAKLDKITQAANMASKRAAAASNRSTAAVNKALKEVNSPSSLSAAEVRAGLAQIAKIEQQLQQLGAK